MTQGQRMAPEIWSKDGAKLVDPILSALKPPASGIACVRAVASHLDDPSAIKDVAELFGQISKRPTLNGLRICYPVAASTENSDAQFEVSIDGIS